ncbi:hypothetical protein AB0M43_06825 [Longispora sp. NPDC051575]|uniref:hypothetical protein n=1 Tax=Longispora sp. NPDC051575 TaxID=3154943 RepID=UPI00343499B3
MTESDPPAVSSGYRPGSVGSEDDPLLGELGERLAELVLAVARGPELAPALRDSRVSPERLAEEVEGAEDALLRATNPQITALRTAEEAMLRHQTGQASGGAVTDPAGRFWALCFWGAVSAWAATVAPLVGRRLGSPLGVLLALTAAVLLIWICLRRVRAHADPEFLRRTPSTGPDWWVAHVGLGLLGGWFAVRGALWPATVRGTGEPWAWAIWAAATAALACFVVIALVGGLGNLLSPGTVTKPVPSDPLLRRAARWIPAVLLPGAVAAWVLDGSPLVAGGPAALLPPAVPLAAVLATFGLVRVLRWLSRRPLLRRLSRDSTLAGSLGWRSAERVLLDELTLCRQRWDHAARQVLLPFLTDRLNALVKPAYTTRLSVLDASGLRLMHAADRVIITGVFEEFRRRIDQVGGGAFGLSGPRGVGKSTLLEYYRAGRFLPTGTRHLAVSESVPVAYDAREFALHLYASLCREARAHGRGDERPGYRARLAGLLARCRFAAVIGAAGLAAAYLGQPLVRGQRPPAWDWLVGVWWQAVLLATVAGVVLSVARHDRLRARRPLRPADVDDLATLHEYADAKLEQIRYQQKHVAGWSGKVGLPFGAEAHRSGSVEFAQQPLTYPEIITDLREFLGVTVRVLAAQPNIAPIPVVMILDELDKILLPERAQEFLNEVKVLFALDVPGCLFLISVSEDALSSFERRGLPIRDAFDSAFEDIFTVRYLNLADTGALLRSRTVGIAEPFVALCHCLAGGLPRDLIRVARALAAARGTELGDVCRELVGADLRRKIDATCAVIARQVDAEPYASLLMRHLDAHATPDPAVLLAAVGAPPVTDRPVDLTAEDHALLVRLQHEALGYLYHCATVLEVFDAGLTADRFGAARDGAGAGSLDALARARQLFAVNSRLAWLTIGGFRAAWGLRELAPPSITAPRDAAA